MTWAELSRLHAYKQALRKAARQYEDVCRPSVSDVSLMARIAAACYGVTDNKPYGRLLATATLLALYAPRTLAGSRIANNLRRQIAQAVGCPPTYVSKLKNKVLFNYNLDRELRENLNEAARRAEAAINEEQ